MRDIIQKTICYQSEQNKNKNETWCGKLIIILLVGIPIVDTLIGYMWWHGIRESVIYKYQAAVALVVFLLAAMKGRFSARQWLLFWTLGIIAVVSIGINYFIDPKFHFTTYPLIGVCGIVFAESTYCLVKKSEEMCETFQKALFYASWVAPLTIIVPCILGVGYPAYFYGENSPNNYGYIGFHASSNEINAVLIILLGYSFCQLYKKFNWHDLISVCLITGAACLIQSRSSFVISVIQWFVYGIAIAVKHGLHKQLWILLVSGCLMIALLFPTFSSFWQKQMESLENTPITLENRLENNLTNGRFARIESLISPHPEGNKWIAVLVGDGFGNLQENMLIEMDFFDAWKGLGLLGGTIFFFYYAWLGLRTYFAQKRFLYCFGLLCAYAFAFMTGHILFAWSPMLFVGVYAANLIADWQNRPPAYWNKLPDKVRERLNAACSAMR